VRIVVRWRPLDRVQRRGLGEFVGNERIGEQRIGVGLQRQCRLEWRRCIERRFRCDQLRCERQRRLDGGLELEWCLRCEQRELPVERRVRFEQRELRVERRLRFEQQLGCGG
jgi:hypothetical protein